MSRPGCAPDCPFSGTFVLHGASQINANRKCTNQSSSATGSSTTVVTPAYSRIVRLSSEELARRRLKGLCFNCPKKFSKEHLKVCAKQGTYYLEIQSIDDVEDGASEEDMQVSLCVVTCISSPSTLKFDAVITDHNFVALVDTGSTHCFFNTDTTCRMGFALEPRPGLTVGVANSELVASDGVCKDIKVSVTKEEFIIDLYTIPLGSFDIVLGCD